MNFPLTDDTLRETVADAARSCRCDGGNTMGCGACVAERRLKAWVESGEVIRMPKRENYEGNPHGFVYRKNQMHSRNRRANLRIGDLSRAAARAEKKPRYIMHNGGGCHLAGQPCEICDRRKHV